MSKTKRYRSYIARAGSDRTKAAPAREACSHPQCKQVRVAATSIMLQGGPANGISPKQVNRCLRHLPKLLCQGGPWPPRDLSPRQRQLLVVSFGLACLQTGASGLLGQQTPWYPQLIADIQQTNDSLGS